MRRIPSPMVLLLALAACGAEEAAPPTSRVDCQQSQDHAGDELAVPESRERAALPHPAPPTPSSELDAWLAAWRDRLADARRRDDETARVALLRELMLRASQAELLRYPDLPGDDADPERRLEHEPGRRVGIAVSKEAWLALEALVTEAWSPSASIEHAAGRALRRIGLHSGPAAELRQVPGATLERKLAHAMRAMSASPALDALHYLARGVPFDASAAHGVAQASEFLVDTDAWLVREYAVAALGHAMPTAEVLAAIAGAQADVHAQVRIAAGRAWARQQGQGPAPR